MRNRRRRPGRNRKQEPEEKPATESEPEPVAEEIPPLDEAVIENELEPQGPQVELEAQASGKKLI